MGHSQMLMKRSITAVVHDRAHARDREQAPPDQLAVHVADADAQAPRGQQQHRDEERGQAQEREHAEAEHEACPGVEGAHLVS
jgi:hypothetical protein